MANDPENMAQRKQGKGPVDIKDYELVFQCEWQDCEDSFSDMESFLGHVRGHMNEYIRVTPDKGDYFSCSWRECLTSIVGNFQDFKRHVYFHAFHVKLKYLGELLVKKSSHPSCSLDKQSRNWIPELPEKLQCGWESCGVVNDNPVIFYQHVSMHCDQYETGNDVKGGCACHWTDCDANCKSKYKLREHLRSHTQEKVIACPTCGGLFANRTKFFDHLTRQKEAAAYCYQCSHCNKRFATERLLRDHMRHHVNHYKCPLCEMTTPSPSDLRMHIRYRHTSEKPYKCGHCSHSAKSAADLRQHLESHNPELGFKCHIEKCKYKAKTYVSLANHYRKIHLAQDVSRYACHLCEKRFTRGYQLTRHLMNKHKFTWPPGHSKFRYKAHEDGFLRLQTVRYESIDVSEEMVEQKESSPMEVDSSKTLSPSHSSDENQENNHPTSTMSDACESNRSRSASTSSSHSSQSALQPVTETLTNGNKSVPDQGLSLSEESNTASSPLLSMPDLSSDVSFATSSLTVPCSDASYITSSMTVPHGNVSLQTSREDKPRINLTFIQNSDQGEQVRNVHIDKNGILVFQDKKNGIEVFQNEQMDISPETETPPARTNPPRSSQTLVYDGEAFVNLEMLGEVALHGEKYTPRS